MTNKKRVLKLRSLFLVDGLGALLSTFLLGIVLVRYQSLVGIPEATLYLLAALPCMFAIYDLYCYFVVINNRGLYLKAIAYANLLYCCLSLAMAAYHHALVTLLGWMYIVAEVIIIIVLARIELNAIRNAR